MSHAEVVVDQFTKPASAFASARQIANLAAKINQVGKNGAPA